MTGRFLRGIRVAAAAMAVIILSGASALVEAATLDQQNESTDHFRILSSTEQMKETAQTFTAGVSGPLTDIALKFGARSPGGTGTITVDIRDTEEGPAHTGTGFIPGIIPGSPDIPPTGGQILATTKIDISILDVVEPTTGGVAGFTPLIHFDSPANIVAGQRYAILLRFDTGDSTAEFVWHQARNFGESNAYAGGDAFYRGGAGVAWTIPNWDFGFRTYVVPEPASLAVLAGAGALTLLRRGRGQRNGI